MQSPHVSKITARAYVVWWLHVGFTSTVQTLDFQRYQFVRDRNVGFARGGYSHAQMG